MGKGSTKAVYEADDMETGRRVAWNEVGTRRAFFPRFFCARLSGSDSCVGACVRGPGWRPALFPPASIACVMLMLDGGSKERRLFCECVRIGCVY